MNESSHAGAPPASADAIAFLQREMVTAESVERMQGECCISQESFEMGDVVISLNCGHKFKEEPITHWLKMHSTCPVCRITI
jgi:E3 ubiquitin-protein ligase RNF115/126